MRFALGTYDILDVINGNPLIYGAFTVVFDAFAAKRNVLLDTCKVFVASWDALTSICDDCPGICDIFPDIFITLPGIDPLVVIGDPVIERHGAFLAIFDPFGVIYWVFNPFNGIYCAFDPFDSIY